MPDDPKSGPGGPPDQVAINADFARNITSLTGAVQDLTSNVNKFVEGMASAQTPVQGIARDLDTVGLRLKALVNYVGDYHEGLQELLTIQKQITGTSFYNSKNFGQARNRLTQLLDAQKALIKRSPFGGPQQKALQNGIDATSRAIAALDKQMKKLGRTAQDALDEDTFVAVNRELRQAVTNVQKFEQAWKNVKLGPVTRHIMDINTALGRSGYVEKFAKYGKISHDLSQLRKQRATLGTQEFDKRKDKLLLGLGRRAKSLNLDIPLDEQGNLDVSKLRTRAKGRGRKSKFSKDELTDIASSLSGKTGVQGMVDRFLGRRVLGKLQGGEEMGTMGRLGARLLKTGGGSITEGLTSAAAGGGEGLLGGAMGLVGKAAVPLAILNGVRSIFDKTTMVNQQVEKTLGTAGIFGGPEAGQQALQNVRTNLTPGGFSAAYNPLGVTYEKNLRIAQQIAEAGVNMSELATGDQKSNNLYLRGPMGRIQQQSYVGARLVGLDETTAAREIVKLLQQYHESLGATDKFFDKLAKDTRAAGLTTTKYLSIIEDVTKNFDQWARSLEDVTSVMRVLGRTGTMTGEQLSDTIQALSGQGQRPVTTRAYLAQRLLSHPQQAASFEQGRKVAAMEAGNRATEALKGMGINTEGIDWTNPADIAKVRLRAQRVGYGKGVGGLGTQQTAALEEAFNSAMRYQRVKQLRAGGGIVPFAEAEEMFPEDFADRAQEMITSLNDMLEKAGTTWETVMKNPQQLQQFAPMLSELAKALGTDTQTLMKLIPAISGAATDFVQQAVHVAPGQPGALGKNEYDRLAEVASRIGLKMTGDDSIQKIRGLTTDQQEKLAQTIAGNTNILQQMVDTGSALRKSLDQSAEATEKSAQLQKAREIAVATRPTAEVFADAFSNLFNQLTRPITWIATKIEEWASHWSWSTKASSEEQKELKDIMGNQDYQNNFAQISDAIEEMGNQIDDLKNQTTFASPQEKEAHDSQLRRLTARRDALQQQAELAEDWGMKVDQGEIKLESDFHKAREAFTHIREDAVKMNSAGGLQQWVDKPFFDIGGATQDAPQQQTNVTNYNVHGYVGLHKVAPNQQSTSDSGESTPGSSTTPVSNDQPPRRHFGLRPGM